MQGLGLGGNLLTGGLGPLRECGHLLQGLSLAGNQVSTVVRHTLSLCLGLWDLWGHVACYIAV